MFNKILIVGLNQLFIWLLLLLLLWLRLICGRINWRSRNSSAQIIHFVHKLFIHLPGHNYGTNSGDVVSDHGTANQGEAKDKQSHSDTQGLNHENSIALHSLDEGHSMIFDRVSGADESILGHNRSGRDASPVRKVLHLAPDVPWHVFDGLNVSTLTLLLLLGLLWLLGGSTAATTSAKSWVLLDLEGWTAPNSAS